MSTACFFGIFVVIQFGTVFIKGEINFVRKTSAFAILLGVLVLCALPITGHAQGWGGPPPGGGWGGPGGGHGGRGIARLTAELGLSPGQVANIKPILDAARTKSEATRANDSLSPNQAFARLMQIRSWEQHKVMFFLTPSQKVKYKADIAMRPHFGGPGAPGGWGGPGGPGGPGGWGHPGQ
jgi:hypothetical protein